LGIEYHGRFVPLRVSHIGVHLSHLQESANEPSNEQRIQSFK
jgi:hypothetical protein